MIIKPDIVQLEISTVCPFSCVYCPSARGLTRPSTFMPFDAVKDLVGQAKFIGAKAIRIFFMGESTVHPDFLDILRYIKGYGLHIYLASNMYGVTEEISDWITEKFVKSDLFGLTFCSTDKEIFMKITGADEKILSRVLKNTFYFLDHCPIEPPFFVKVSRVVCEHNDTEEETKAFEAFFSPWVSRLRKERLETAYAHGFDNVDAFYHKRKVVKREKCRTLDRTLTVLVDGTIALCPVDFNGKCGLGNAFDGDLLELHNSEKMNEYREKYPLGICRACGLQGEC